MKIKKTKKIFPYLLTLFLGTGLFFLVAPANASWAADVIGGLLGMIIGGLGLILSLIIQALVAVAQYKDFIHAPAVSNGWVVVRDVCNMFFVLILLIIAFATILKVENYSYKKWLPKLILMAILINFSKTICGLLIDFAQIVMLTFVNAFKDMAAGNMVTALGIQDILTLADNSDDIGFWQIIGAYLLGLIYLIVALVVIVTMLAMLVMRIVMIWIYIVLSPAAYLMSAFPGGQKYASQWWSEFSKNLIVGPVLAFFIWLSFVSLQAQNISTDFPTSNISTGEVAGQVGISGPSDAGDTSYAASNASTPSVFIKFIIAIGMLVGGLKISQEIGGAAGGIAGKGMSKLSKGALVTGGAIGGFALGRAKAVGRSVRNQSLGVASYLSKKGGTALNNSRIGKTKVGDAMIGLGNIGSAWRADMQFKNQKKKKDSRQKFLEKMGMGEKTMDKTSEFLATDTGKEVSTASHGAAIGAALLNPLGVGGMVAGGAAGFVIGGAVSKLTNFGSPKFKNKQARREREAGIYQQRADQAEANGFTEDAEKFQKHANEATRQAKRNKFYGDTLASTGAYTSELTQKAAYQGSLDTKTARNQVGVLAEDNTAMDGSDGFAEGTFYSKSGQTAKQKKFFEQLTNADNAKSGQAITNLQAFAAKTGKTAEEQKRLEALARGLAAFKKGKGDTSRLSGLIAAVSSGTASTIGTVDSLDGKVIANRKTGAVGEKGSGGFYVDTFAKNDGNESGKNVVGVDFNKIKGAGLDVNAEASIATGSAIAPIAKAISEQIAAEKTDLASLKSSGGISDEEFTRKNADLDRAQSRLNNPNELKNLNLVNTASANYGRQEKMASVYHEEIHAGGVEDEDLTEGMAKKLMENKLYGRNAATGGRHATEIAQKAKDWKAQGMSNDDIMGKVDEEIKSRVGAEGKSRAERVTNLESGKKETESQALGNKAEEPTLNTEDLQKSLDTLTDKVKKMASSFKPLSGSSKGGGTDSLLFPLKQLNVNMRKNVSTMQAISKKTGGEAPTTIIEASAINDEVSS